VGYAVIGESGLGKSTLVNTLFLHDLYEERNYPSAKGILFVLLLAHVTCNLVMCAIMYRSHHANSEY